MRYATFSLAGDETPRLGVVHSGGITEVSAILVDTWRGATPTTLLELIQAGPEVWRNIAALLAQELSQSRSQGQQATHTTYDASSVRWHAPIPRLAKNVFCLGLNYFSHVVETSKSLDKQPTPPEVPLFFTKSPTTVNGPYDPVPWDRSVTAQVDYEAELGVIVGITGKNLRRATALSHVFGYTVINDVSARDLQFRHKQWFKGKSLDGFCPMGPVVVTADEFGDPQNKRITLRVNGETRQDATTADMIFSVDVILEFLSQGMTLEPGDVISTGTPDGVGLARTPPEYLEDGDVVETEIEGIGMLRNQVRVTEN